MFSREGHQVIAKADEILKAAGLWAFVQTQQDRPLSLGAGIGSWPVMQRSLLATAQQTRFC